MYDDGDAVALLADPSRRTDGAPPHDVGADLWIRSHGGEPEAEANAAFAAPVPTPPHFPPPATPTAGWDAGTGTTVRPPLDHEAPLPGATPARDFAGDTHRPNAPVTSEWQPSHSSPVPPAGWSPPPVSPTDTAPEPPATERYESMSPAWSDEPSERSAPPLPTTAPAYQTAPPTVIPAAFDGEAGSDAFVEPWPLPGVENGRVAGPIYEAPWPARRSHDPWPELHPRPPSTRRRHATPSRRAARPTYAPEVPSPSLPSERAEAGSDPWPELPDELEARTDAFDAWREVDRQRRLDTEQQGRN